MVDERLQVLRWQQNPLEWVEFVFGKKLRENRRIKTENGLTTQQTIALEELGKLIRAKLKVARGEELTPIEREYAGKVGISIQSGTGTGKDFLAAIIIFFFLYCFPNSKVTATANSSKQLKNVLWSELSKIMSLSRDLPDGKTLLDFMFEMQSERINHRKKGGKRWFAEAVTINTAASAEAQGETLAGRHEDYMLFVIDEASGIPEPVFKPIEGTLTGVVNIVLMVFNPTRSSGFAVRSHKEDRGRWIPLRWDSRESEMVPEQSTKILLDRYGEDSNQYRIRVLGLPPLADKNTLIPWDWIEDATQRELDPLSTSFKVKGWDFGAGGDKSVICTRHGGKVLPFMRSSAKDSNELTDWIVDDFKSTKADIGFGDVIGIGWAVLGNLRKILGGNKARSVDSRGKASNQERFHNKRAENHWRMRTAFEAKEISIPNDEQLLDQLRALQYTEESGKIKIASKKDIKKVIESDSPDESDALANTFASYADTSSAVRDPDGEEDDMILVQNRKMGWMAA